MNDAAFTQVSAEELVPATTSDWVDTGVAIQGAASAVYFGGGLYAFGRANDDTLAMWSAAAGQTSLGGTLASSPSAVPSASGNIAVLARMQSGAMQVLFVNPLQKVTTAWTNVGGAFTPVFTQSPLLVVDGLSLLNAFALATTGVLWTSRQTGEQPSAAWTAWTSIGGPALNTSATGFAIFLAANTSLLTAAALGADGTMVAATQQSPGGAWSAFAPLTSSSGTSFANGPAAAFCTAYQAATYGAWNLAGSGGNQPVVVLSPPVYPSWSGLPLSSSAQTPLLTSLPVMTNAGGLAQLIWLGGDGSGQTYLAAQSSQEFWYAVQSIGSAKASFTGAIAAAVNGSAIAIFQTAQTLWTINLRPATTETVRKAVPLV